MLYAQTLDVNIVDGDKALRPYLFAILDGNNVSPVTGIHNFRKSNVIIEDIHWGSMRASVVISGIYYVATYGKIEAGDFLFPTIYGKAKAAESFVQPYARALQSNSESGDIIKIRLI